MRKVFHAMSDEHEMNLVDRMCQMNRGDDYGITSVSFNNFGEYWWGTLYTLPIYTAIVNRLATIMELSHLYTNHLIKCMILEKLDDENTLWYMRDYDIVQITPRYDKRRKIIIRFCHIGFDTDAISLIGYTKINDYRKLGLENAIYMRCCIETLKEKVWEMVKVVACKHNAKKVLKEGQDEWSI